MSSWVGKTFRFEQGASRNVETESLVQISVHASDASLNCGGFIYNATSASSTGADSGEIDFFSAAIVGDWVEIFGLTATAVSVRGISSEGGLRWD